VKKIEKKEKINRKKNMIKKIFFIDSVVSDFLSF